MGQWKMERVERCGRDRAGRRRQGVCALDRVADPMIIGGDVDKGRGLCGGHRRALIVCVKVRLSSCVATARAKGG